MCCQLAFIQSRRSSAIAYAKVIYADRQTQRRGELEIAVGLHALPVVPHREQGWPAADGLGFAKESAVQDHRGTGV